MTSPSDGRGWWCAGAAAALGSAVALAAALGLAGCAGAPQEREMDKGGAGVYTLTWGRPLQRKPGDGIVLDNPGGSATMTVTSTSGIGEAQFQPTSGTWPRELRLEFQYAPGKPFTTLEGLRLETRANSFDSSADWPRLELKDLPVRRSGTQFWFTLPEGWLVDQQPLRLEWVDRYR